MFQIGGGPSVCLLGILLDHLLHRLSSRLERGSMLLLLITLKMFRHSEGSGEGGCLYKLNKNVR